MILVDVDTGKVLYQSNAHTPLPPGSLTKTLTAIIAADWLPPNALVPATPEAANVYPDKVGMQPGQEWPLPVVLHSLITYSANDAAYALAQDIGGSLNGFTKVMQESASEIGMRDHPVLEDPAGLDGREGNNGGNRISAWDLAISARDMMANPTLAAIAAQQTFAFTGPDGQPFHIVSRNLHFLMTYPGAIGVKTGFTNAAGYCDIEEAVRGGRHMLAVVLNSTNPDANAASLISNGFALPVNQEAADAPTLPAVRQPEPLAKSPPPRLTRSDSGQYASRPLAELGKPSTHTRTLEAIAAVGVTTGAVLLLRQWSGSRRRRRRTFSRR